MKIKTKLILSVGGSLTLLLALSFKVLIALTTNTITDKLDDQLENQVMNITAQVSNLITTSARSYLIAVGDKSNSISDEYYSKFLLGEISYDKARELSIESIIGFNFLDSGTVFVADNMGVIISHSDKSKNRTISPMQAWIQRLKPRESAFKAYEYQSKNKLVYRVYNRGFDYNICVDANTSEFLSAVDIDELNRTINSVKIGKTGYPFLLSKWGEIITNPNKEYIGMNFFEVSGVKNSTIFSTVVEQDKGLIKYLDDQNTQKILLFNREGNSELVICITGAVSEFYDTITIIKRSVFVLGIIVLVILSVLIFIVSSTITIPIRNFIKNLDDVTHGNGDLTKRISLKSTDEISDMVTLFNSFLDTIQNIIIEIKKSVQLSFNIKNHITYRINETAAAVKKILVNIVSIKNQTKQLDSKVEKSVVATKAISNNIKSLNLTIDEQTKVIGNTTKDVSHMIASFNEIENLVSLSRDNTLRITARIENNETLKFLEEILKSLESIKNKTDVLHIGSLGVLKNISLLEEVSNAVTERSKSIKRESDDVEEIMVESEKIASYVVESMDMIINSTKKISLSMEKLDSNTQDLEDSSDVLQTSINRFKT